MHQGLEEWVRQITLFHRLLAPAASALTPLAGSQTR
jgi:hypothetical protein